MKPWMHQKNRFSIGGGQPKLESVQAQQVLYSPKFYVQFLRFCAYILGLNFFSARKLPQMRS